MRVQGTSLSLVNRRMEVSLVVVVKRLTESCLLCFRSGQVHLKCAKHQHENSATLPLGGSPHFKVKDSRSKTILSE